jgi:hypothetical protein
LTQFRAISCAQDTWVKISSCRVARNATGSDRSAIPFHGILLRVTPQPLGQSPLRKLKMRSLRHRRPKLKLADAIAARDRRSTDGFVEGEATLKITDLPESFTRDRCPHFLKFDKKTGPCYRDVVSVTLR